MPAPIALQLYSVRDDLAKDFIGVMTQVAKIGYVGVEPTFQPPGSTVQDAAQLFRDLGLRVPSAHVPLPLGEQRQPVLDFMAEMGSEYIVSGKGPDSFASLDLIKETCDLFNEAYAVASDHGLGLGYHNHWWEFERVGDQYVYELMLEHLNPAITLQIDTYWVQTAGPDPVSVVTDLGARAPLLHIKDGPAQRGVPQVAIGDGVLDVPGIVRAAKGSAQWLIVELDECATGMLNAVEKSYNYLVKNGLARGNQS